MARSPLKVPFSALGLPLPFRNALSLTFLNKLPAKTMVTRLR